jgi:hypothetical protein
MTPELIFVIAALGVIAVFLLFHFQPQIEARLSERSRPAHAPAATCPACGGEAIAGATNCSSCGTPFAPLPPL